MAGDSAHGGVVELVAVYTHEGQAAYRGAGWAADDSDAEPYRTRTRYYPSTEMPCPAPPPPHAAVVVDVDAAAGKGGQTNAEEVYDWNMDRHCC